MGEIIDYFSFEDDEEDICITDYISLLIDIIIV